ncbi:xaa-Arg dipeptidase-like [Amphiura filiformis]|uniref:xaa-Arg dipeptidase-like n=1 Tax=Amphiura filiformis TaxID=82378 RepID=UPI003B22799A
MLWKLQFSQAVVQLFWRKPLVCKTHISTCGRGIMTSSNVDDWQSRYNVAKQKIDSSAAELHHLSQAIWAKPELNYNEHFAHKTLTDFLEKEGFKVERNFVVDTAFRATYGSDDGLNVCVISEYDALPDIGHACGHNLIAESGIAAGIAVKAALELNGGKDGKVTVMGTPAEEGGAGKVKLIKAKAFDRIHVAMMVHPKPFTVSAPTPLALQTMAITYTGKPAHAAAYPWEGLNALDAAVMCYNAISVLRQQMKPRWRVHGVISNGGQDPAIIPEVTELQYYLRAPNKLELEELKTKVEDCIKGAATISGCKANYEYKIDYLDLKPNSKLVEVYEKNGELVGIKFSQDERLKTLMGSTDMGNVSYEVPSIHPLYDINTVHPNHTREFTEASGAPEAQKPTLDQAKAMALTALDILKPGNEQLIQSIQAEFEESVLKS